MFKIQNALAFDRGSNNVRPAICDNIKMLVGGFGVDFCFKHLGEGVNIIIINFVLFFFC